MHHGDMTYIATMYSHYPSNTIESYIPQPAPMRWMSSTSIFHWPCACRMCIEFTWQKAIHLLHYCVEMNWLKIFFFFFHLLSLGLNACEKKSYIFLRKELPVRLANIMKEITLLPDSLSRTPSIGLVSAWYARSFEEVLQYEQLDPTTTNMEK